MGRSHPEAKAFLVFGCSMETANLPTFLKFANAKNQIFVLFLQKSWMATKLGGTTPPPPAGPGLNCHCECLRQNLLLLLLQHDLLQCTHLVYAQGPSSATGQLSVRKSSTHFDICNNYSLWFHPPAESPGRHPPAQTFDSFCNHRMHPRYICISPRPVHWVQPLCKSLFYAPKPGKKKPRFSNFQVVSFWKVFKGC